MKTTERALKIIDLLEQAYPDAECSLTTLNALQLLIATRLSAQCTDKRVNMVTPALFARYPDAEAFAGARLEDVEELIRSCGLYKTKARDIIGMCKVLVEEYGGRVPGSMEQLLKLPGVGRKTANLVMGDFFGRPAIVADTHCIRISNRLGFVKSTDAYKVELALLKIIPPERSNMFCHRLVYHGRAVCTARNPNCPGCVLKDLCPAANSK